MKKRIIIFGDIHGCYEEWQELLDKTQATEEDQLVTVGDLCCKGPSTRKVLDLAMSLPNLTCVMGNHDFFLYERWKTKSLHALPEEYQHAAVKDLGKDIDRYMKFISKWPFYLELEQCNVVHAGIRPGRPIKKQDIMDLLYIRKIDPDGRPWYEDYKETKLIVHGHWAKQGLVIRENVIGLDTGCVYGRKLSCVILPERKIVSMDAHKAYAPV